VSRLDETTSGFKTERLVGPGNERGGHADSSWLRTASR
jgi:hypothetical protein